MDDKRYLVFYHIEDNDGLFSAAIIYNYLLHELNVSPDNIKMSGVTYDILAKRYAEQTSIDALCNTYDVLIMTDISFNNIKTMKYLYKYYQQNFIWIDHHLPIIQASAINNFGKAPGIRDHHRSAILNAYRFFYDELDENYRTKKCPELFRILSGWDSFSYEQEGYDLDYVRNINKGTTFNYNLELDKIVPLVYDLIYNNKRIQINGLFKLGEVLNCYDDELAANQLKQYGDADWYVDGRRAVMIMCQGQTNSQMFKYAKKLFGEDVKHGIVLKYHKDDWILSLYNISEQDEFHCGEYLKKNYKGGGHKGAAGCTLSHKQFDKLIKVKYL